MQLIGGVGPEVHARLAPDSAPPPKSEGSSFRDYLKDLGAAEASRPQEAPKANSLPEQDRVTRDVSKGQGGHGGKKTVRHPANAKNEDGHKISAKQQDKDSERSSLEEDSSIEPGETTRDTLTLIQQTPEQNSEQKAVLLKGKDEEAVARNPVSLDKKVPENKAQADMKGRSQGRDQLRNDKTGLPTRDDGSGNIKNRATEQQSDLHNSPDGEAGYEEETVDENVFDDAKWIASGVAGGDPDGSQADRPIKFDDAQSVKTTVKQVDGRVNVKSGPGIEKNRDVQTRSRKGTTSEKVAIVNDGEQQARPGRPVAELEVHLNDGNEPHRDGESSTDEVARGEWTEMGEGDDRSERTFMSRLEHPAAGQSQRQVGTHQAAGSLSRRLNGELGTNIVRQAKILLSEADKAEIRLVLRPPELGRVRINLQLENGHIAGRILVDNGSVREVMEQNLPALQRAFADAGLDVGDFDVSTGDPRDQQAPDGRSHPERDYRVSRGRSADAFADSITVIEVNDYSHRRINLVA